MQWEWKWILDHGEASESEKKKEEAAEYMLTDLLADQSLFGAFFQMLGNGT
jgi:hypothetical protein